MRNRLERLWDSGRPLPPATALEAAARAAPADGQADAYARPVLPV